MRINGPGRPGGVSSSSGSKGAGASGAVFRPDLPHESAGVARPRAMQTLSGIDTLIAVQGLGAESGGRRRAARRGNDILDILDELKIDLLCGAVSRAKLDRLLQMVEAHGEGVDDARLAGVLKEIELRARVELAKLGVDGA